MKKTCKNSYFEAVSSDDMPGYGNRIIQVGKKLYCNTGGYSVHVCEISDDPETFCEHKKLRKEGKQ